MSVGWYDGIKVQMPEGGSISTPLDWAKSFDRFLDSVGVHGKVHLFGSDLGGLLAQTYREYRPLRVETIILCNSLMATKHFDLAFDISSLFDLFISPSLHLFISSSLHLFISSSLHLFISPSLHLSISSLKLCPDNRSSSLSRYELLPVFMIQNSITAKMQRPKMRPAQRLAADHLIEQVSSSRSLCSLSSSSRFDQHILSLSLFPSRSVT